MENEIKLLKERFNRQLGIMKILTPMINSIWIISLENQNFESFADSVKKYDSIFGGIGFSEGSLDDIISDAKLFLNSDQLERFYSYAKREYDKIKNHLNDLRSQEKFDLTEKQNLILERIYFENSDVFHYRMPISHSSPNPKFVFDLLSGIDNYVFDFESEIESLKKLKVPIMKKEGLKSLSLQEGGLYCYYNFSAITREQANDMVENFGKDSGDGLYNWFTHYSEKHNRIELPEPCTHRVFKNKIKRFKKIINLLPEDKKSKAQDELDIIKRYDQ